MTTDHLLHIWLTIGGIAFNLWTFLAMRQKKAERDGEEKLQHELMWKDFKARHGINGSHGGAI
jgi:deoxyribodipyrimidine photolyase